jgi:hypothetical protein
MTLKPPNNSPTICGSAILCALVALFFSLKYLMPISAEDYLYINNFSEFIHAALHWNSRLGEILFRLEFAVLSPLVWLFSAIGSSFFFVCIFLVAFRRFPELSSISDMALTLLPVLCVVVMPFDLGVFTIMDQWGNYIFSSCFFALAYTPIAMFLVDGKDFFIGRSPWWRAGYYVIAFLGSWSHELVAIALLATVAWTWITLITSKHRHIPKWTYGLFFASLIGLLFTLVGASHRISQDPQVQPLHFVAIFKLFYRFSSIHLVIATTLWLMLIPKVYKSEETLVAFFLRIFNPAEIIIISCIILVMGVAGFYPTHTHVFALIFIYAAILRLCALHLENLPKISDFVCYLIVSSSLLSVGFYTFVAALPMYSQRQHIDQLISDELQQGKTTIAVPYEVNLAKECYHYFLNIAPNNPSDPNTLTYVKMYYAKKFSELPPIVDLIAMKPMSGYKKHWFVETFNGCL